MTAPKRWVLGLALAGASWRLARAADVKWNVAGDFLAVWTDNVYFESNDSETPAVSTTGAELGGGVGLTSTTPRSDFTLGYKAAYRNFPQETNANNLEQYLTLSWDTFLSQRTSFTLIEAASSSPEADNFEDRGVDQGLTVGTRARQFRNTTGIGINTWISPRWSIRADYAYRLLDNGKIQRPEDAPPPTNCNEGFCTPPEDTNGDGTPDTPEFEPSVESLDLLDERGHAANLGFSHQLTPASDLTFSATYLHTTTTDDLFGGSTIRKSHSYGGNVIYAWTRTRTAGVVPEETEGPADVKTVPGAPGATPATPEQTPPQRRPIDEQPVAPLSAGSDRPRGGVQSARVAAQRAAGPRAGKIFLLPEDTLNLWFGVGVYRVTDTLGSQLTEILRPKEDSLTSTEYAGEIGLIRTYGRGAIAAGLTHGVSTFEGLGQREIADLDGDGIPDTEVQIPAGSALRTTLYGSYVFTLTRVSHFAFSLNATRRVGIASREFDFETETEDIGETRVTTLGAGVGYDLQFAEWGGMRVSYRYTTQNAPGRQLLSDLDYGKNTATLGMFFTTR